MAVIGDYCGAMTGEVEREDAGVCGVDQTQPDALAASDRKFIRLPSVDGHQIADPAVVAHIVKTAKITADRCIGTETPVVEYPGNVPVDPDRFFLLDDQRAI